METVIVTTSLGGWQDSINIQNVLGTLPAWLTVRRVVMCAVSPYHHRQHQLRRHLGQYLADGGYTLLRTPAWGTQDEHKRSSFLGAVLNYHTLLIAAGIH